MLGSKSPGFPFTVPTQKFSESTSMQPEDSLLLSQFQNTSTYMITLIRKAIPTDLDRLMEIFSIARRSCRLPAIRTNGSTVIRNGS